MFDKVIVSSDEHFKNFFPIVSCGWRKFFPEVRIAAAFVTDRSEDDPVVDKIRGLYDEVKLFPPVQGIPTKNVAKMVRFLYASEMGDEVCTIEDVDTIPLQVKFFADRTAQRNEGHLLAVGQEVYRETAHHENFPVSTITGEGYTFKKLFNPNNEPYLSLFEYWETLPDEKGATICSEIFSDEGLISQLTKVNKPSFIQHIERGVTPSEDWIDRSNWKFDLEKLKSGGYVICNFMRPFESYFPVFKDVIEFIVGEGNANSEELILE
jgi:hypothetical protein